MRMELKGWVRWRAKESQGFTYIVLMKAMSSYGKLRREIAGGEGICLDRSESREVMESWKGISPLGLLVNTDGVCLPYSYLRSPVNLLQEEKRAKNSRLYM